MWVGREIPLDVEGSKINRSFILFDWKNIVNIDGKWELYKWLEEVSNGYFVANGKTSIWKAKINNMKIYKYVPIKNRKIMEFLTEGREITLLNSLPS